MASFNHQLKKGLFWTALDKYIGQILSIITSMVLARLLTPDDFGVVATATVVLGFLNLFVSIGIGPAVIQKKDLSQNDLDNIFTFTLILGLALGGIAFSLSWAIADFYGNQQLVTVMHVLSFGVLFSAANMVPAALMSKNFRFREMATRSVVFQFIFGCCGIISALLGAGIYALICPQIISSLCTFIYNRHFYPVKIAWRFKLDPIKRIFSYSSYVFLSETMGYISRNLDKLLIGKMISPAQLGYYDKSYRLMQMPLNNISSVIYPVLQPVMSSFQNDMKEMSIRYTRIVSIIASLSFPIAAVLYFSSTDIIAVMFGEKWLPAVPAFKILSLSIPLALICNPNGAIYLSCNATKQLFLFSAITIPILIISFIVAGVYGKTIESFAWAWTLNELLGCFLSYYILFIKVMKISPLPLFKELCTPILSTIILVLIYCGCNVIIPTNINYFIHLIIFIGIGILYILIALKITGKFDVISYIKSKVNSNRNVQLR